MTPLSIGTDTDGSIRGPANNCGVVGLKQTYGRVSRYGVTTLSWTLDHAGPMTKTVADAAFVLQAIAGADPMDPTATQDRVPDYTRSLIGNVKGLRIGIPTNYFFDGVNPQTVTAVRAAVAQLRQMGATLVDVAVPHVDLAGSAGWIVAMAEAACFHEPRMKATPELFDPIVRERLDAARFYPATNVKPGSTATPYRGGNTFLGNMTGLPAIVIPWGFTTDAPNLPLGIQFYAKPFDEGTLFRVSHAYESSTNWHTRRPPLDTNPKTGLGAQAEGRIL